MIHILSTLKMQGSVSSLNIVDDKIYALDNKYNLSVYSNTEFDVINRLVLLKETQERHVYDKSYAISSNLNLYVSEADSNYGICSSLKDSEIVNTNKLDIHQDIVSFAMFSHNSNLLAIGAEDGVVFFYNLEYEKTVLSFPPRADTISSISFSKNDKFVSIGSFDKSIIVYNIESNKELSKIILSNVPEASIFLNGTMDIAGITRDKRLFIYKNNNKSTSYLDFSFDEWPTSIEQIGNNHIIVGTRGDTLYLINIDELEVIKEIKLNHIGVKTLTIHDDYLYIGYISGDIDIIDTMHEEKQFDLNLKLTNYDIATSLIDKNIFLITSELVKEYDKAWEQVLDIAKDYLLDKNIEAALKIAKPFFFDKKKLAEYNFLNSNSEEILQFNNLVKNNKDIMAFKLADEKQYLKESKEYLQIEAKWQKVYQICKMMFEKDTLESSQKAIDTLKKYMVIPSKKENISCLIKNYKDFIKVHKLIKARNFRLYFILTEKKPFLMQEELYKKVNKIGNQTYTKLITLEQSEEFEQATNIAQSLKHFTDFKVKVTNTIERIDQKVKLQDSILNDELLNIYEAVNKNSDLECLEAFREYHKKFESSRKNALDAANSGKTNLTYNILEKYFNIEYLIDNIATVFKLSYITEMENQAQKNIHLMDLEKTIDNYISFYGVDNELASFIKKYAQEYTMDQSDAKESSRGYLKKDFVDSIVFNKQ